MLERKTSYSLEEENSPVNRASVFQEASNLLPPDDPEPPLVNVPVQLQMGYNQDQQFIKRLRPEAVTDMGSGEILRGLEKLPEKNLEPRKLKRSAAKINGMS